MTTSRDHLFPVDLDTYRTQVRTAGMALTSARKSVDNASDRLKACVLAGIGAGLSENEAAKLAGVTRQTVRAWLGK